LRLVALADDDESGVSSIEYRIGTTVGGLQVFDWQPFVTSPVPSAPDIYDGPSLLFALEPGTRYYVSFRATNGDGLATTITPASPVVYDPSPPTAPSPLLVVTPIMIGLQALTPPVYPPVSATPEFVGMTYSEVEAMLAGVQPPSATAKWTAAVDGESGIAYHEYDRSGDPQPDFARAARISATTQTFQAFGNAAFHASLPGIAYFPDPRSIVTSDLDTVR